MDRPLHDVETNAPQTQYKGRAIALGIVGALHAFLIYALVMGLASGLLQKSVQEIKVAVVHPQVEKALLPPPPPQLTKPPPPFVPPPEVAIQQTAPVTITTSITPPPPAPTAEPAEVSSPIGIGRAHACGSRYYPASASRLREEGTTQVTFTVTANGDVTDVSVVGSSGHSDLDSAAIPCVMTWKYKPAVQNGKPVAAQWTANVVWKVPL